MPHAVTPARGARNDAAVTYSDLHGIDCHRESSRCDLHPPSCEFYERTSGNPHKMPHGCPTMFAYLRIGKSDPRIVRRKKKRQNGGNASIGASDGAVDAGT
ncbi:MAG: hypothetical protein J0H78_22080 [Rhizobiales bacterium]|nr:hypothetical protein [Hyphomicrobiales bacterium]